MVNFPEHFERCPATTGRRVSPLAAHAPSFPAQFLHPAHPYSLGRIHAKYFIDFYANQAFETREIKIDAWEPFCERSSGLNLGLSALRGCRDWRRRPRRRYGRALLLRH